MASGVAASARATPPACDGQHATSIADADARAGQHRVSAYHDGVALDNCLTAAWADVDRDGDLDPYVGNHNGIFGNPDEGPHDKPGRRDVFYMNNGDGTFTDLTMAYEVTGYVSATGLAETAFQHYSSSNALIFADLDNDRWPDLLVTNKLGGPDDHDMLYRNLGRAANGTEPVRRVRGTVTAAVGGAGCVERRSV